MPNIAIVWDFDGTLTPGDSTSVTIEALLGEGKHQEFWKFVKSLKGQSKKPKWEHVLAQDAPIWMYSLSRIASSLKIPLNAEFFEKFVLPRIKLYDDAEDLLLRIKKLENNGGFKKQNIQIHHFIITAGLKDLVEQIFPQDLITWTFGCRYKVIVHPDFKDEPESVPVFCMDETMKTRSLFEISKGTFAEEKRDLNTRFPKKDLWAPFENIIYIGDGDTDIPALSLVRDRGGIGILVFNPMKKAKELRDKHKGIRKNKRADLITSAIFTEDSELYEYLKMRCNQIRQRYEAESN